MSDTLRGALWMIGTIVSFSVMAVAGRELISTLSTFEMMMYRSAVGLLIVSIILTATGRWAEIRTRRIKTHLARNAFHFIGQNLWFFSLAFIPLAQVFALEFTTPLWVILLSPFLLGERFTKIKAVTALIGFIGVLFVAQPGSTELNAGVIAAASCAVFFALSIILTKRLTETESIGCIMFYLTAMQLVFGTVISGYDGDISIPSVTELPFVVAIAIAGLTAHFCYTKALSLAPATIVSPIDFARLPTIAIIGWLIYNEALDPFVFLGAGIIFAANYLNIWSQTRKSA